MKCKKKAKEKDYVKEQRDLFLEENEALKQQQFNLVNGLNMIGALAMSLVNDLVDVEVESDGDGHDTFKAYARNEVGDGE